MCFSPADNLYRLKIVPKQIDLPNYVVSELLHDLDIAPFLNDVDCNRRSVPFYPNTDGWNKGEII